MSCHFCQIPLISHKLAQPIHQLDWTKTSHVSHKSSSPLPQVLFIALCRGFSNQFVQEKANYKQKMTSLGTSKEILEIAKFAVYVSVPIGLMYFFANNTGNLQKVINNVRTYLFMYMYIRKYIVFVDFIILEIVENIFKLI